MHFPDFFSVGQRRSLELLAEHSLFLEGRAGTGKTTVALENYRRLIQSGVPAENILVIAPQRSYLQPYFNLVRSMNLNQGTNPSNVTLGGLARRLIMLFWPVIVEQCGFKYLQDPPAFLTLETAQYYMARIVKPMLDSGAFSTITLERNRLYSQIIDNMNKAAGAGMPLQDISARLKSAWGGEATQLLIYEEAQLCALRFREYCLENNLLDFSLQVDIFSQVLWNTDLCQQYLMKNYHHLIYENVEEDIPVFQDIAREWLPNFQSALVTYDTDGGYRTFLGSDVRNGYTIKEVCNASMELEHNWVTSPEIMVFQKAFSSAIIRKPLISPDERDIFKAVKISHSDFFPEMLEKVSSQVEKLVLQKDENSEEIVILSPFMSDSLRFSLMSMISKKGISVQSHRPSRSLRDEPSTQTLFTLAKIAHPQWLIPCSRAEVRSMLVDAIHGLDLVRADLLSRICFNPNHWENGFSSFEQIQPSMQERIGYFTGLRFEKIRSWLNDYLSAETDDLDIFFGRLFGELLSQPGFGFHENLDYAASTAKLTDSIEKFRQASSRTIFQSSDALGKEYLTMVRDGVIAAQFLQDWVDAPARAVLVAPAHTFLTMNRVVKHQFWLDIGSLGWWQRLYQPLTHPVVLGRSWNTGKIWTDFDEQSYNIQSLDRLTSGLLSRCSGTVYLNICRINQQGEETRGRLVLALQSLIRDYSTNAEVMFV